MPAPKHILLITGFPGIGKTTIVQKIIAGLPSDSLAGFYTEEIRENHIRQGFELVTLDGKRTTIAHTGISSNYRVGKYGVDVMAIDLAVSSILSPDLDADIFIVDEIGKMECFSQRFIEAMEELFESGKIIVATVALKGKRFISKVKSRDDIDLLEVTRNNRDFLPEKVINWIGNVKNG